MYIHLVGHMGAGKSAIGRKLAKILGVPFTDTDRDIARRAGMSIAEIFTRYGEEGFRAMERDVLQNLVARSRQREEDNLFSGVVATGGGMSCSEDNMELLRSSGVTVYLKSGSERLISRLAGSSRNSTTRPAIASMNERELRSFLSERMILREPYYSRAHITVECDGLSDWMAAERVAQAVSYFTECRK